jgi:hypothetical protein
MPDDPQRPYQTYTYPLASADALAWRTIRNDWSVPEKLFGLGLIALAGLGLAAMPEELVGKPFDARFIICFGVSLALTYALFRAVIALNDRRLARNDIPALRMVTLEDWVDHLDERWAGGRRSVALEMISSVLETATHVFVQSHGAVIIIPAAAFASAAEKQAFAVNLEAMAQEVPSWASTDWASPNTPD